MKQLRLRGVFLAALLLLGAQTLSAVANADDGGANAIEKIETSSISGQTLIKVTLRQPLTALPSSFTVSSPPRVAFDFLDTENISGITARQASLADLQSINLVQAGSRTRLVLNLSHASRYDSRFEGNVLFISLAGQASPPIATANESSSRASATPSLTEVGNSVQNIEFRAESKDVAQLRIDLSDPNPLIDVKRQGPSLILTFQGVRLPDRLVRRLDVRDFGTPMQNATTNIAGKSTQVVVNSSGDWDYNVTQVDTSVKIEVRRITTDPNTLVGSKELQGKTVSFNFTQPIPVSQMLGIFQDITGLNFMMMPGVTGEIERLKMENTPVETAIDVIGRMYGLSMRRFGDLVVVGKAADLAKYEKDEYELKNVRRDAEPIEQETIRARYRPAAEIVAAITVSTVASQSSLQQQSTTNPLQQAGQASQDYKQSLATASAQNSNASGRSMISTRGSISFDPVTNMIFVEETRTQLAKIRERVEILDKPVKQVMIEARIVSVNTTFSKALGSKINFSKLGAQRVASVGGHEVDIGPLNFNSNGLGAPGSTSGLSFSLFNPSQSRILSLELTATENDGLSKNIASPKILTQDGRQATITDGTTLYFTVNGGTNSGPTTVAVDAATKLEVTPQIGADGKVQLKVYVNKGGVGASQGAGTNPSVTKQEVVTNVVVENGGTLMLGGVFSQIQSNTTERVPLLGDIPYLGWLFKQNTKKDDRTELLIFLTPRIVTEELTLQ